MSKPGIDKKTEATFKTVDNLRASTGLFKDVIEAASNYKRASQKLSEEEKKLADALQRLAASQNSDVGDGINKLAEIQRTMEIKRENYCRSIQEDLINTWSKGVKQDENDLGQFESNYKKTMANSRQNIAKLESFTKKAGKKGGTDLQQAIKQLDAGVKESDKAKAENLRQILLIERKKYCTFLAMWNSTLPHAVDISSEGMRFKEQQAYFTNLAASVTALPPDAEALVNSQQERTFVQISGTEGSYGDSFGSFSSSFNSSVPPPPPSDNYGGNSYGASSYGGSNLGTATAIYDFAGDQPSDLPFFAGEVLTVTGEDDGSGWLTGELNGRTGIFPSSYVERR